MGRDRMGKHENYIHILQLISDEQNVLLSLCKVIEKKVFDKSIDAINRQDK